MKAEDENAYDRRRGPRDRSLRVGDREREAVAAILRRHHVEGRLDAVEFQERLDRCLAARTYGDLDRLIADFPGQEEGQARAGWASARPRWPGTPLPPALISLAALTAAIILSGGHLFWLAFPLFFFVVRPLLWQSLGRRSGYGFRGCAARSSTRSETTL